MSRVAWPRSVLQASLLRCARDPSAVQDQLDTAELLLAAGFGDEARMLYDVAFIRMGFSPARMRDQARIAAQTALWGETDWSAADPPPPADHAAAIAVAQLRALLASVPDLPPLPDQAEEMAELRSARIAAAAGGGRSPDPIPQHVMALCADTREALRQPAAGHGSPPLGPLLARLHEHVLDRPFLDPGRHVDADLPVLAACVAFDGLRHFLLSNHELAYDPFGSAGLLHAAAHLESGGLGPYLADPGYWIARSGDVFGLIQLAAGKGGDGAVDRDLLERWSVLLSQHVRGPVLHELVDDLADLGLMRAVRGIHERGARHPQTRSDPALMRRIRDVGLDDGDLRLALRAQRQLVGRRADLGTEWLILGEIEATAGHRDAAEAAFVNGLGIAGDTGVAGGRGVAPGYRHGLERLRALRAGQFAPYAVTGGYGSFAARRLIRSRRRQAGTDEAPV